MCTQLLKMLFLATFFPAGEMDEDEEDIQDQEVPFVFFVVRHDWTLRLFVLCGSELWNP